MPVLLIKNGTELQKHCLPGHYNYPTCKSKQSNNIGHEMAWLSCNHASVSECECNIDGSTILECNDNGKCTCKDGFEGKKCDTCKVGFTGSKCDACKPNIIGELCDACQPKHFNYPTCQGISKQISV